MSAPTRFTELVKLLQDEYDRASSENASHKSIRAEWSRKMEEQANELNSMLTEFHDLERKHLLVKEQYEAEILRLKGQTAPQTHPTSSATIVPQPPSLNPKRSPAYASTLPPENQSIPPMFSSRSLPHVQQPIQSASALRPMMSSLPSAAPSPPPTAIPSITNPITNPSTRSRPNPPIMQSKMPGITIPQHPPQPRDPNQLTHPVKKDPHMSSTHAVMNRPSVVSQPAPIPFGHPGIRSALMNAPSTSPTSQSEGDWCVYNGKALSGLPLNMKVDIQHSLPIKTVVCCVRYSWDGQYLATGSNRAAHIFDVNTGQTIATFARDGAPPEENKPYDQYVRAVCFSPDGKWLITGAEDHMVKVWDIRNRKVKYRLTGHSTDIYSVDASQNGQFIISGSGDKNAKLWSLESGELLATLGGDGGPTDGITSVSISPNNQLVAAGSLDKVVRVWDVATSCLLREFKGHADSVYSVAFSPDGRMLLSGSLDCTLKLWDLSATQPPSHCRMTFEGHLDFVLSVAFSPNGQWLISGSKDRSVRFWDPRQPIMRMKLMGHKNSVISIAHSPVAKAIATGSGDCRTRTWAYS